MTSVSRRSVFLAGAVSLLHLLPGSRALAATTTGVGFVAPKGQFRLSRTVRRELAHASQIVVRRDYVISFLHRNGGYTVQGEFVECQVDAPPLLNALANLERTRVDEGIFPLSLTTDGLIMPKAEVLPGEKFAHASRVASGMIAQNIPDPSERAAAGSFISHIGTQGAGGAWPEDLFCPTVGERSENRTITLADGQQGHVFISIAAKRDPRNAFLSNFRRTVTTDMAGIQRVSHEEWTLTPAA